jgi:radical SAM superfamily enzyme YgiQ (UPF0313 family)
MVDVIFTRTLLTQEEMYGNLAGVGSLEPSLGLCYLAAATRENGFKTEIIDALALGMNCQELAKQILDKAPKYVGISSVTLSIHYAGLLAKIIKEKNRDIKIIIGGAHITAVAQETMEKFPDFDIGVLGEGEVTIVELIKALEAKKRLGDVQGIIFRDNAILKTTPRRDFIKNLDDLPMPAWDLLPAMSYYSPPAWSLNEGNAGLLITSRGCASRCIYCDRAGFGNVCRAHSADYVMRMIRHLYDRYNIRHFRINDDNFILFKKRLYEICRRIINEGPRITWSCFARADTVSPEILKLMKMAGCWQISYGVETASQEIHNIEEKNIDIKQIERAIKSTHRAGIKTIAFCMIGHPLETPQTIRATIDFVKRLPVDDFKMMFVTPFPGTELYANAQKYGSLERDWRKMNAYIEPCFIPNGMTKQELIKYRNKAFREFYLQPRVIFSYLISVRSVKQLVNIVKGVAALFKLLIKK